MPPNLTNLLPDDKLRSFRRVYFFRLLTVTAYLIVCIVAAHTLLLFPTHILLASQIATQQGEVERLRTQGAASDQVAFEKNLEALLKSAARIEALAKDRPVGEVLREVLSVSRTAVSLTSLSYQPQGGAKKVSTVILAGVAGTRDALRAYQIALQGSELIDGAELPVSAYTKETDIPFSITLTLSPQ